MQVFTGGGDHNFLAQFAPQGSDYRRYATFKQAGVTNQRQIG